MDEHRDTCEVLAYVLIHLGHSVGTVPDAGTALDRLRQDGFDLLLVNIWPYRGRGWGLIERLRAHGGTAHIVSMSVMHVDEARGPSKVAGCFAHLVQPFKFKELEEVLERVCIVVP